VSLTAVAASAIPENKERIDKAVAAYTAVRHEFDIFRRSVVDLFALTPSLNAATEPVIHSVRSRTKDAGHLADKLARKLDNEGRIIGPGDVFREVTDLAGVRVLHLHQGQFTPIHNAIMAKVAATDWSLAEPAIAYSWDPEAQAFFEALGIEVEIRDSYYTSIHYIVKPRPDGHIACEIQVRTLFEEIWGEIDHALNYPHKTSSLSCSEQLRVLAKLVSTGTRLADAIFRVHDSERV
jgi:putative GTP pyrophosphokinase